MRAPNKPRIGSNHRASNSVVDGNDVTGRFVSYGMERRFEWW